MRLEIIGETQQNPSPGPATAQASLRSRLISLGEEFVLFLETGRLAKKVEGAICTGARQKDVKLPFLEVPAGPVNPSKDGAHQHGPSPHLRANHSLERKHTYYHFSSPVRLAVKPPPYKPRSDFLLGSKQHGPQAACKPSAYHIKQNLMVSGVTCGPLPRPGTSLLPQIRPKMELHVYVPNGKENTDAGSLDEGFLEEMDNRPSSLHLPDS
ncbi:hypothetical protein JRQ81_011926 [Phrynocephalus forsythii]|uniref:Uncharacterized protein n=1 Tax=Phrynocephalus forsythii TaxID=171643 RepID=A0A9Q0X8P1_9SAUR|nr:hypothetical protein JRQ81_011926 [Phrynocephalus forsythii]